MVGINFIMDFFYITLILILFIGLLMVVVYYQIQTTTFSDFTMSRNRYTQSVIGITIPRRRTA